MAFAWGMLACSSKSEEAPAQPPTKQKAPVTDVSEKQPPKTPPPKKEAPPKVTDSMDYKFIEQRTVPGYTPDPKRPAKIQEHGMTKHLLANKSLPSGWKIAVDVAFGRCETDDFRCWNDTAWVNKRNPLVDALPKVHREDPKLVVITTPIARKELTIVSVYILSFVEHSGATKMRQKAQWQTFALYATNGTHYLNVTSKKERGIAKDIEELQRKLPRSTLTNETRRIFSVYEEHLKQNP